MYSYVDHRWFKAFLIFFLFSSTSVFATSDWEKQKSVWLENRVEYGKRVYGMSERVVRENAHNISSKDKNTARDLVKRVVVEDVPTRSKVGASMFSRVKHYAKTPGIQMVGVIAVTELLEAIDWVMDEGTKTYKKKVPTGGDFASSDGKYFGSTPKEVAQQIVDDKNKSQGYKEDNQYYSVLGAQSAQVPQSNGKYRYDYCTSWKSVVANNPCQMVNISVYGRYTGNKDVFLTPTLLGSLMLGEGYSDPTGDASIDDKVNTGHMDSSVADAYVEDPTGVGNELSDEMDRKMDNAQPTPNGKPAPKGDPRYSNLPTSDNPSSNDRYWYDDAGEATGNVEDIKDPDTGESTGDKNFSMQFPVFCDWASIVCEWIDWTKEDEDLDDDDEYPEIKDIEVGELDTSTFKATAGCPAPIVVPISFAQNKKIDISYEPICKFAESWSFVAPLIGFLSGAMIVIGVGRKGEDGDT